MKDFLIVYEVKKREIENAFLLKVFLEDLGYSCDVSNFYESEYYSLTGRQKYKVIIVPQLYHTEYVQRVFSRFGPADTIFNLQCEQVLSDDFELADLHTPKGAAKLAHHVCWGPRTHEKLLKSGIPKERLPVLGALSVDFLRSEILHEISPTKYELAERFSLDLSKRWILFTSSFTFADMPEDRRKMDERLLGIDLSDRIELFTESRKIFLLWFEEFLASRSDIVIYRPHPDEYSLAVLYAMAEKYPNFKVIPDYSVRIWTYLCDSVLNWYSTSCVDAYFLNKPYFVLRPLPMPVDMELTLMKRVGKVDSLKGFMELDLFTTNGNFHDKESMDSFYYFDADTPSILKHVDALVELHKHVSKTRFSIPPFLKFKSAVKTYLVFILHQYYCRFMRDNYSPSKTGKGSLLGTWFRAFYYNIANESERSESLARARRILDLLKG